MSTEKCDNYEICAKYAIYGKCEKERTGKYSLHLFCEPYQKQIITILASIDDKLSKLLEKK